METDKASGAKPSSPEGPTRWGNQLNGNYILALSWDQPCPRGPTRWGNQLNGNILGFVLSPLGLTGPTRWGNQLNGNPSIIFKALPTSWFSWPHSLGQSVEWKLLQEPFDRFTWVVAVAPLAGAIS